MDQTIVSVDRILNQLEEHAEQLESQQKLIEQLSQEVKELKSKKR